MLKNNILIKISGSIAAYKTAYLISKLVQHGFNVKAAVTDSALHFIGKATLEGLTGNPVYSDSFEDGKMMSHINLIKWADLIILVPADANTINKFSSGIGDNLVTSLFLARDNIKPYLIAPAMNVNMYNHPATRNSLNQLKQWGVKILPTDEGHLACGDEGKGKLLEPDKIFDNILLALKRNDSGKRILITSGGTKEKIDQVRYISNISSGKTGAVICDYLAQQGYDVTFVKSADSAAPSLYSKILEYDDFKTLKETMITELKKHHYFGVIHLAAVSDYSPNQIILQGKTASLPKKNKIKSIEEKVTIILKRNSKIINEIKSESLSKNIKLIGFKYEERLNIPRKKKIIGDFFRNSNADLLVFNSIDNRINGYQKNFELITPGGKISVSENANDLAKSINEFLMEE